MPEYENGENNDPVYRSPEEIAKKDAEATEKRQISMDLLAIIERVKSGGGGFYNAGSVDTLEATIRQFISENR